MADTWNTPPLVPNADNDSSIGTSGKRWKDMHAVNFHGNLDGNAATATTATTATKAISGMGLSVINGKLCIRHKKG